MKASFALPNGTRVEIDGTPDDVQRVLSSFTQTEATSGGSTSHRAVKKQQVQQQGSATPMESAEALTEMAVVNRIKDDESLKWLHQIIDSRDMTRRVLMPLYVAAEIDARAEGLTSGFISRVYAELGVRLDQANASTALSGKAKRFVLADVQRRKGSPVRYKISRAGRAYLEQGHA